MSDREWWGDEMDGQTESKDSKPAAEWGKSRTDADEYDHKTDVGGEQSASERGDWGGDRERGDWKDDTEPGADTDSSKVNSVLAAVISLCIPGLGQLLSGQTQRGALILAGTIGLAVFGGLALIFVTIITFGIGFVLFLFVPFVWPIVHIVAAIDAYLQAEKINSGEVTPESEPSI